MGCIVMVCVGGPEEKCVRRLFLETAAVFAA